MSKRNTIIELTPEEIADIHARGKLTPEEIVEEWELDDACPTGDAADGAADRCDDFAHNCHACLIDYANSKREWCQRKVHKFVARGYSNQGGKK